MTYHNYWPIDGKELKRQLNAFLQRLRVKYPGIGYLWVLEFQTRNAPHFHLFLTIPESKKDRIWLAETWNRIADPSSKDHLYWHRDRETIKKGKLYTSFITWDMGSGSYLCKYLDKSQQKLVPAGFRNVGGFWRSSRGLVPPPDKVPFSELNEQLSAIDEPEPSTFIVRTLGNYHEKINPYLKRKFKHSRFKDKSSYSVVGGAPIFRQLVTYLSILKVEPSHDYDLL